MGLGILVGRELVASLLSLGELQVLLTLATLLGPVHRYLIGVDTKKTTYIQIPHKTNFRLQYLIVIPLLDH